MTKTQQVVNVLLVDDQPANLMVLEGVLDDPELNLVRAASGEEALSRIQEQDFALILLDIQMPGMDGFETAARIRQHERARDTPIIFLTAIYQSKENIAQGYASGAVDYLVKPLVPETLRTKVKIFAAMYRRVEQARRRTQSAMPDATQGQWKQLLEQLEQVIFSMEMDEDRIVQISPTCELVLGFPPQAFYEDPRLWRAIIHPDDRDVWDDLRRQAARGQATAREYRVLRPDGTMRWLQVNVKPDLDNLGRLVHLDGALTDVSDRKRTEDALRQKEEQFLHAQRLEVVGLLAGGVVHDFNNMLTSILGQTDLLLRGVAPDTPMRQGLEEISKAAQRASALSRQFLAFSRKEKRQAQVLDLNPLVGDMERMMRRLLGENIELQVALAPDLKHVYLDPAQLEQVLLNLVINARDAMPRGGHLTIETANVELDSRYEDRFSGFVAGPYVMLAVSDTGIGMDQVVRDQIFEPFFTTKERGRGTGLGLSTVYAIVKQSGGNIMVYSEPGRGTSFKIYLPLADDRQAAAPVAPAAGSPRGTETILVAEDDPSVRHITEQTLLAFGYTVLTAADAQEAIELFPAERERIALLLTDIALPGMNGVDLARHLRERAPGLRILFMTGYADTVLVNQALQETGGDLLPKPFTPGTLAARVREALDRNAESRAP